MVDNLEQKKEEIWLIHFYSSIFC